MGMRVGAGGSDCLLINSSKFSPEHVTHAAPLGDLGGRTQHICITIA
jgi:hypothetical protein